MGRMTAQAHNRFVFCVVVVKFAVNGNQALEMHQMKRFIDMEQSPLPMFLLLSTWLVFSQLYN